MALSNPQKLDACCSAQATFYTYRGPSTGKAFSPVAGALVSSSVKRSAYAFLPLRPLTWVVNRRTSFLANVGFRGTRRAYVPRASEEDDGLETFNWGEGSIVIPKFDENFFPIDETGAVIDMPSPRARKKKKRKQVRAAVTLTASGGCTSSFLMCAGAVTAKLDADGNPVVRRIRTSSSKASQEATNGLDAEGKRQLRTRRDIAEAKRAAARRAKAKLAAGKKKAAKAREAGENDGEAGEEPKEGAEAEQAEPAENGAPEPEEIAPPEEDEEALFAELEGLEAQALLDDAGRRQLAALRRDRKGRLLSELRATALKQVSSNKMVDKRAELLAMSTKLEKQWHVVNCTVPEAKVAAAFRERLDLHAPAEEVDIRTPELPQVKILKSGEARHFSTFVTNNVLFVRARLTPEVLHAMSVTPGLYNIDGAENRGVMSVTPGMQAERFIKMIDDAEREVQETIAAAQARIQKEKEEAARKKEEAAAARKGKKEQGSSEETVSDDGADSEEPLENRGEGDPSAATGKYAVGSDVMVARGPFAGLPAEVTARDTEKEELKVKIMILGQFTEVDVKFKDVRPAKTPASKAPSFNPFRRDNSSGSAEQSSERSQYGSALDWDVEDSSGSDSDRLKSGLGSGSERGYGGGLDWLRSGSGGESEAGPEGEEDESDRVPLRSGVGVLVKKGPFKGCTGHVVDVLLEKGLVTVQIPDEGELQFQPRDVAPEDGATWSLPEGFQVIAAPVRQTELPKPKKQLLWLDEDEEEAEPVRELGADGRPKDPDWAGFERKPRGGVENDLLADQADPRQAEIRWQKLSFTTPEGKTKRLMVKYLGTNADNSAEMLLTEDIEVVTAVWRRLKPAKGAEGAEKKGRKKKKDAQMPAFM